MNKRYVKHKRRMHLLKKLKGCNHCGYNENTAALQWDHIIPVRRNNKQKLSYTGPQGWANWNINTIRERLKDYQILCANCHAIKSYEERHTKCKS